MISIEDLIERQCQVLADAVPIDRRREPDRLSADDFAGVTRGQMLADFWGSVVPGSGAYDEMLTGAVVAAHHLGWHTSSARAILGVGWDVDIHDVARRAQLGDAVFDALEIGRVAAAAPIRGAESTETFVLHDDYEQRVLASWQGQIAGGSFGTALEGCSGEALASIYGPISGYVAPPTTLNDDVVYELVALDVLATNGVRAGTEHFANAWLERIPFGWSAEWMALDNLRSGVSCLDAATLRNPMREWIGAQMRAMVFGQVYPGEPSRAAAVARREAAVSHRGSGAEGAAFSAILRALSFGLDDARILVSQSVDVLRPSAYREVVVWMKDLCAGSTSFADVWPIVRQRYRDRNWIDALPNIGAVISALWFCENDFTNAMAFLAQAGLDVDCNAGLVGSVLGAMNGSIPNAWIDPLHDTIDTYLPDLPSTTISATSDKTLRVRAALRGE